MNAVQNVLSRLAGKLKAKQAARAKDWRTLVGQLADGLEPDVETVEEILGATGKSGDDLAEAVALLVKRRELAAVADKLPAAEAAFRKAETAINEENARQETVKRTMAAKSAELFAAMQAADLARQAAARAAEQLRGTMADEEFGDERAAIMGEIRQAMARRDDAERRRHSIVIGPTAKLVDGETVESRIAGYERERDRHEARAKALGEKLQAVETKALATVAA